MHDIDLEALTAAWERQEAEADAAKGIVRISLQDALIGIARERGITHNEAGEPLHQSRCNADLGTACACSIDDIKY